MPHYRSDRNKIEALLLIAFLSAFIVAVGLSSTALYVVLDMARISEQALRTHVIRSQVLQMKALTLLSDDSKRHHRDTIAQDFYYTLHQLKAELKNTENEFAGLLGSEDKSLEKLDNLLLAGDKYHNPLMQRSLLRAGMNNDLEVIRPSAAFLRENSESVHRYQEANQKSLFQSIDTHQLLKPFNYDALVYLHISLIGALAAILAFFYRLTRRKIGEIEYEQRLTAAINDRLAAIIQKTKNPIITTNSLGIVVQANLAAERVTGKKEKELQGKLAQSLAFPIDMMTGVPVWKNPDFSEGIRDERPKSLDIGVCKTEHGLQVHFSKELFSDVDGGRLTVFEFQDHSPELAVIEDLKLKSASAEKSHCEEVHFLQQSEHQLKELLSYVSIMIAFIDKNERYTYVNHTHSDLYLSDVSEIIGKRVIDVLGEYKYAIAKPKIEKVLQGVAQSYERQPYPGFFQAVNLIPRCETDGEISGYFFLAWDITEKKQTEERINSINEELALRVQQLERMTKAHRTLSFINKAMARATTEAQLLEDVCNAVLEAGDYSIAAVCYCSDDQSHSIKIMAESGYELGKEKLKNLTLSSAEGPNGNGAIGRSIRTGKTQVVNDIPNDPGYAHWKDFLVGVSSCVASPILVDGEIIGAFAIFSSSTNNFGQEESELLTEAASELAFGISSLRTKEARKLAKEEAKRLTHSDTLTGLANGTRFIELLKHTIDAYSTGANPFAVVQVNIKGLREINDALGFEHSDNIIREVGLRLQTLTGASTNVARLRGNEFAMLVLNCESEGALEVVDRIRHSLRSPFSVGDIMLDINTKIGAVLCPDHGNTVHHLLRRLDIAVGAAETDCIDYSFYDSRMERRTPQRLTMAGELRRAIENGDMRLYVQPKLEMATGKILGQEALVRWQHFDKGIVTPNEFIGLAEQTGLIQPLTDWVIEASARLSKEWSGQPHGFPIAVNLSARNLQDQGLAVRLRELRDKIGVSARMIELEVTETAVMVDNYLALRILNELKEDGHKIYLDDYGTGHCSLRYLQQLPVDYVKIDQSFVRGMIDSVGTMRIVKSTIDLAHDLGKMTVAEGVETKADWDQLVLLGCDVAQGYFIAKPMPAEAFPSWVACR